MVSFSFASTLESYVVSLLFKLVFGYNYFRIRQLQLPNVIEAEKFIYLAFEALNDFGVEAECNLFGKKVKHTTALCNWMNKFRVVYSTDCLKVSFINCT